jgi:hypothetical protein
MLLQKEEEKLRAAIRLEGTRKRAKEKNMARGLSGNYLEDEAHLYTSHLDIP